MPKKKVKKKPAARMRHKDFFLIVSASFVVIILIVTLSGYNPFLSSSSVTPTPTPEEAISAVFTCPDGEKIHAKFINGNNPQVDLTLPDERTMTLSRVISADGGKYANRDESTVFWNVGTSAMFEENGAMVYSDCESK